MLKRIELDCSTGRITTINQVAVRNAEGNSFTVDEGEEIPVGFYVFNPQESPISFPPSVPKQITVRQAKLEMIEEGIYSQLLQYKSMLPEKEQLILEAELSGNFMERDSPVVLQIAQLLGISDQQLDQLFINAEKR